MKTDLQSNTPLSPDRVFGDLWWITGGDMQLGSSTELLVDKVVYERIDKPSLFSSVIKAIVDKENVNVMVAGLATFRGAARVQSTVLYSNGDISILYDADACAHQGSYTYDDAGDKICVLPAVALYHELIHAFRHITNQSLPGASEERAAIGQENLLRAANRLELRALDSWNIPGGCGKPDKCGGKDVVDGGASCFVVKACFGSGYEAAVGNLRDERNKWASREPRFAGLLLEFYPEYYAIGTRLARLLMTVPAHLEVVREVLIKPYLAFWHVLYLLAEDPQSRLAMPALREAISATMIPDRHAIQMLLAQSYGSDGRAPTLLTGQSVDAVQFCLAQEPGGFGGFPLFRWAVLEPIRLLYSELGKDLLHCLPNGVGGDPSVQRFVDEALGWARSCPSESGRSLATELVDRLRVAT
ncbi:hypothetical protein ACGFIF_42030 [Kribbella sp. NPDC049174]|uniref:hypothetical protein n=1 Tax=Kribbella sp. NPDC049174 TaxID=3364112 RepID=UPI00371169E9